MRILVVTVSDVGRSLGDGVTALSLARAFSKLNHEVTLVAPMPRTRRPAFRPGAARIVFTPSVRRLRLPANLNTLTQLVAVLWLLATWRPDLVYIRTSLLSPLIAAAARFLAGCRVVCEHNGLQWEERLIAGRFAALNILERWSQVLDARLAHRVRTVIPAIADRLVEQGVPRDKFFVIGNAANVDLVVPLDRETALRRLKLDPGRRYMGFIGSFAPWQGLPTVLDALAALRERDPRICCLLAGDGPLRESLERDVKSRGLETHCIFLGEVAYQDVPAVLGSFDVALMPTDRCIYATLGRSPLKLRDYAAAGRVVVAADVAVVHDLASEEWLKLYPVGDARALAAAVAGLLDDDAARRRLGALARAYAERNFSWETIGRTILREVTGRQEEQEPQPAAAMPSAGSGRRLKVCIVARKNLEWNTRVFRQALALSEAGHEVTVVCVQPPHPRLAGRTPGVRYLTVMPAQGLTMRAVRACDTFVSRAARACDAVMNRLLAVAGRLRRFANLPAVDGISRAYRRPLERLAAWLRDRLALHPSLLRDREFRTGVELALSDQTFDCVQAHDSYALAAAGRLRDRCHAKLVYDAVEISTARSGWMHVGTPRWVIRLEDHANARIIKTADCVLTVSKGLAAWLTEHYGLADPVLVRNCRNYERIERSGAIRAALGLGEEERLGLYLNSVYEGQGLEQLVDALCHLPHSVHVATLGPLPRLEFAEALIARAAARGVDRRFHVLQPMPADEMLSFAAGADVGVIPRQNTSFNNRISLPNRIFELVMARLPIAAPSLPDMKAFVAEYGLGLSFDETDPRDIARVIQEMLRPANLERFRAAAERAAGILCWENEGPHYVASVESLFAAQPAAAAARDDRRPPGLEPLAESFAGRQEGDRSSGTSAAAS